MKIFSTLSIFFASFICANVLHAQVGYIYTIAGNGINNTTGDNGPATAASIANPNCVHVDSAGNIYFTSVTSVRKISTSGIITTIAGNGTSIALGEGGPATAAGVVSVGDISSDNKGNVFLCDAGFARVRKIDPAGIITTVAGSGSSLTGGDGGPATDAGFEINVGITVDTAGNLYISESSAYANDVRKVDTSGIINRYAGYGSSTADGVPATAALVNGPGKMWTDRFGNIYIPEFNGGRVRKVNPAGIITTVAGNGAGGFSGDGGPATAAGLNGPSAVAVDGTGNLYIADYGNERIRKVNTAGIISTICGDGTPLYNGDGQPATAAELNNPPGVSVDCAGNVYIADLGNMRIRMIRVMNNAPYFNGGHSQSISACAGTPLLVNALLTATDLDTGQQLTWSDLGVPAHGSVSASYPLVYTTGGALTLTGVYYTPAAGYTGSDSFKIVVTDCGGLSDTTTIHVTINTLPDPGTISGIDSVCSGRTVTLSETLTGGLWASDNTAVASVGTTGVVTGAEAGHDTITYAVTSGLGCTAKAIFPFKVYACPDYVPVVTEAETMSVYPNPNSGAFGIMFSSSTSAQVNAAIVNLVGEKIREFTIVPNQLSEIKLDVPPGMYFLNVSASQGKICQKILVTAK